MSKQVVVKGESVYECSVCKRKIRVPSNKFGLDIMQRCSITAGCKGKLSRVTLTKDINSTPAFPPEIQGVEDWFQRKILYTHQQTIESQVWLVEHDLGNKPIVHSYLNHQTSTGDITLVSTEPVSVRIINLNVLEITFDRPVSGLAQCISLASENLTNITSTAAATASTAPVQITTNGAELTIATLSVASEIDLTVSYTTSAATPNVDIEYPDIDTTSSLESPWTGVRRVMVNGRRYTVRTLNLATSPNAAAAIAAGVITNGSPFRISLLNGNPIEQHQVLILLARPPFATVDRIYDRYIDTSLIDTIDPETYWDAAKGFCRASAVKTTYPAILVV